MSVRAVQHFRPEDGVMLGERVVAFDLKIRLGAAGDAVEEDGLFDGRHERMANAAQHGVIRPDSQVVFAAALERAGVMAQMLLSKLRVYAEALRNGGIELPHA